MARHIDRDQPMGDELAHDRAPGVAVMLGADAEGRKPVMAEPADALVMVAEQHRDDMRLAETLARAVDGGQKLLRGNRAVESLGWVETDTAIAARPAIVAEIAQQHLPAALRGF